MAHRPWPGQFFDCLPPVFGGPPEPASGAPASHGPTLTAPPPTPFAFDVDTDGDNHIVRLHGELDDAVTDEVRTVLIWLAVSAVVADLSDVTFMNASGLSALVAAKREITRRGHDLRITGASGPVREIFSVAGLSDLLDD
jgi:stage II sporulation protein AA (anti-sigma F factor antagonist)